MTTKTNSVHDFLTDAYAIIFEGKSIELLNEGVNELNSTIEEKELNSILSKSGAVHSEPGGWIWELPTSEEGKKTQKVKLLELFKLDSEAESESKESDYVSAGGFSAKSAAVRSIFTNKKALKNLAEGSTPLLSFNVIGLPRFSVFLYKQQGAIEYWTGGYKVQPNVFFSSLKELLTGNSRILFYIHGYATRRYEALSNTRCLQQWAEKLSSDLFIIPICWPSEGEVLSYDDDRNVIVAIGTTLRTFFQQLDQHLTDGQSFDLLCHSMGNWLAYQALDPGDEEAYSGRKLGLFFSCSPAIFAHEIEALSSQAKKTIIYHSRNDRALTFGPWKHSERSEMFVGLPGFGSTEHPIYSVDCTDFSPLADANQHSYYLCISLWEEQVPSPCLQHILNLINSRMDEERMQQLLPAKIMHLPFLGEWGRKDEEVNAT